MTAKPYNGPGLLAEGRAAFRNGSARNPYEHQSYQADRWSDGWSQAQAQEIRDASEETRRMAINERNERLSGVRERLEDLRIDPHDLRDFLAELPERY